VLPLEQPSTCQALVSRLYSYSTQVCIMTKGKEIKRENFDVSPEQQADIETLQILLETPSKKDAVLMAVQLALHLAAETKKGNQFFVGHPGEDLKRFVMLGIEKPDVRRWMYLVEHSHPWKR